MAQQAKVVNDMQRSRSQVLQRTGQLRLGVRIELVTIIWMTIEASIAIVAGFATHSVSLQGFGIDSIIELISGGVLLWRLRVEQRGGTTGVVERAERRAAWITALSLFALAVYIVGDSAFAFLTRSHPEASWWGIGLAIAAAIAMPLLWRSKLRIARRIESAALKADAMCSVTCAYMAITLLVGLLLNKFFGWWWADPVAALAMAPLIAKEGVEALQGKTCCDADTCTGEAAALDARK